jgi:hypothetical protein
VGWSSSHGMQPMCTFWDFPHCRTYARRWVSSLGPALSSSVVLFRDGTRPVILQRVTSFMHRAERDGATGNARMITDFYLFLRLFPILSRIVRTS